MFYPSIVDNLRPEEKLSFLSSISNPTFIHVILAQIEEIQRRLVTLDPAGSDLQVATQYRQLRAELAGWESFLTFAKQFLNQMGTDRPK